MTFEAGLLVGMPFPFSDRDGGKTRPAVVLSTRQHQAATGHLVVCAVTSNLADAAYSVLMRPSDVSGRLPRPSRVKVDHLFTVHPSRIERTYGTLKPAVMRQVWKEFHAIFPH